MKESTTENLCHKNLLISILLLIAISCSCNNSADNKTTIHKKYLSERSRTDTLNVSVFLDLSDRISPTVHPNPTMEYFMRDTGYISSVVTAFENHVAFKKSILMNDNIQVFMDPTPPNQEINELLNNLRISLDSDNATLPYIQSIINTYRSTAIKIYEHTIENDTYIGSDIWSFFKNKAEDYCIDRNKRNVLVILTDGYVYHTNNIIRENNRTSYLTTVLINNENLNLSNWKDQLESGDYGFMPFQNVDLTNLEVLVLGINPYPGNPYESDIIQYY